MFKKKDFLLSYSTDLQVMSYSFSKKEDNSDQFLLPNNSLSLKDNLGELSVANERVQYFFDKPSFLCNKSITPTLDNPKNILVVVYPVKPSDPDDDDDDDEGKPGSSLRGKRHMVVNNYESFDHSS